MYKCTCKNYIDGKILSSYDKHVNHRNTLLRVLQLAICLKAHSI